MNDCNFVWLDGVFSSKDSKLVEYAISPHELLFSFEKLKISNETQNNLQAYLDNISNNLRTSFVETLFTIDDIKAACKELLKKNCIENGHLKISILKNSQAKNFAKIVIDCW